MLSLFACGGNDPVPEAEEGIKKVFESSHKPVLEDIYKLRILSKEDYDAFVEQAESVREGSKKITAVNYKYMEVTVNSSKGNDKEAVVNVTLKNKNLEDDEKAEELWSAAVEAIETPEFDAALAQYEEYIDNAEEYVEESADLKMKKEDGIWKLDYTDQDTRKAYNKIVDIGFVKKMW